MLAGKACRIDFAFNAAFAKATGHQYRVKRLQLRYVRWLKQLRVKVLNFDLGMVVHAGVAQGFVE